jgi:hypothetical protein
MLAYALNERDSADFVRSLALRGAQPPDTASFDGAIQSDIIAATVALALGATVWFSRGRPVFVISAIWSVLSLGTAVWRSLEPTPLLRSVVVGPLNLPMTVVGLVLGLAAVSSFAGSVVGWLNLPSQPGPLRPHVPPMTHQD